MSKLINYNQRSIILHYTNKSLSEVNFESPINIQAKGSGEGEDYKQVEQEAQLYLIRNAMLKKPAHKLKKIVGIRQNTIYGKGKKGSELKITLEGIAIFK